MTDKIVIGGTEFPTKITVGGRPCTRQRTLIDSTLYDIFGRSYKGQFVATLANGDPLPPIWHSEPVETVEGMKRSYLVFDDIDDACECYVKDSAGRVVATAPSILAAQQLVTALNKQPTGCRESKVLGLGPSLGVIAHTPEDKFAFWCIKVDPRDGATNGAGEKLKPSYLQPIQYRYGEYPSLTHNPTSALRFAGNGSAKYAIKIITEEILPTTKAESTMRKLWNWEEMKPVMVKFAYNVVS